MRNNSMWVTRGFDSFREGTFGNGGHNIYVSRAGVLQRIHQYDFNKNGYFDLIFCNDHNHGESPPVYIYKNPLDQATCIELPAEGASSGEVADLNGNGYDDIIIGNLSNGMRQDLNAIIYYGSSDGYSERRHQLLPAPACLSVAAGDFNGDQKVDLVFVCQGYARHQKSSKDRWLRIFYQTELGFEQKQFEDVYLEADQITSSDLDGDGFDDLIVRLTSGEIRVYWGGSDGIDFSGFSISPLGSDWIYIKQDLETQIAERNMLPGGSIINGQAVDDTGPLIKVISLGNVKYIFVSRQENAYLIPIDSDRQFGLPIILSCPRVLSIAVGDVNGNGLEDIVLASRERSGNKQVSWIYWGDSTGYNEKKRTPLETLWACDVVLGDLDKDGRDEVIFCQMGTETLFTSESYIYQVNEKGLVKEPLKLVSHDARRSFLLKSPHELQILIVNNRSRYANFSDVDSTIYFGSSNGFSPERRQDVPSSRAVDAVCADINDDGYVDLVMGNSYANSNRRSTGSYVLLNGPEGFPSKPSMIFPTDKVQGLCCADLNRSGYLDLIFASIGSPDLLFFFGNKNGFDMKNPKKLHMERDGITYGDPRWIYLADLNNNGWLDLFVPQISDERSFVLWGGPKGFSMERSQMLSVFHAACASAADLNGNGYLDLIIGGHEPSRGVPHDSFAYIYWNGPEGLKEDHRTLLPTKAVNGISIADFNNDGLLDLFFTSYHDGIDRDIDSYIYWNHADRGFSSRDRTRLPTHSASGSIAADFNNDGYIDLAIGYHRVDGDHLAYSAVWWNGPNGFSEERLTKLPTAGPHGMNQVGPGNIIDRSPEEYYISVPFHLPEDQRVLEVSYEAEIPPKTWVTVELRFAETELLLDDAPWLEWLQNKNTSSVDKLKNKGEWVQYKLSLGAESSLSTPRLTEVKLKYGYDITID